MVHSITFNSHAFSFCCWTDQENLHFLKGTSEGLLKFFIEKKRYHYKQCPRNTNSSVGVLLLNVIDSTEVLRLRNGFDLISVNATRGEEQRVEEFPPNVTSFSIRRLDRYTRYRFSVAARTQVGLGEWHTEESPHYTTESNSFVASAAASRTCTDYDDLCGVCVCQYMPRTRWTLPHRDGSLGSCVLWLWSCSSFSSSASSRGAEGGNTPVIWFYFQSPRAVTINLPTDPPKLPNLANIWIQK